MSSIFDQIIEGKLPCDKVYEDEAIIAFHDIAPQAPVHILIVPKKRVQKLQDLDSKDMHILEDVVKVAQTLAKKFNILEGYRLLTNNGALAGQTVFHLHFHLIGGKQLGHQFG
ncbi:MAG: Purine nucleoside phosphoramidase [Chlamydiae bacterium]|nr:Purine nucleoside phosphoramidase [Chlamydiota bacterium]